MFDLKNNEKKVKSGEPDLFFSSQLSLNNYFKYPGLHKGNINDGTSKLVLTYSKSILETLEQ